MSQANTSNQNTSITQVAALARVSTATVSRVLSGRRAKNDDIAKRVRKAAEQLNYSANYAAIALRSDTTNTIGLILPSMSDLFSTNMLIALDEATRQHAKLLIVASGDDTDEQNKAISDVVTRNVDGLMIIPAQDADLTYSFERYNDSVPMVQISGEPISFHVNWVGVDKASIIEAALLHLIDHTTDAVAYFSGNVNSQTNATLFAHFQTLVSRLTLVSDPDWTTFGELSTQRGYHDAMRLFTSSDRKPNGIICASDSIAIGVFLALEQLGIRVPEDVQVISCTDGLQTTNSTPTLTSIRPPYQQIAREAIRLILAGNEEKHWLPAHTELRPEVIRRQSTSLPRMGTSDMSQPTEMITPLSSSRH